jgi:hypothetical protein
MHYPPGHSNSKGFACLRTWETFKKGRKSKWLLAQRGKICNWVHTSIHGSRVPHKKDKMF